MRTDFPPLMEGTGDLRTVYIVDVRHGDYDADPNDSTPFKNMARLSNKGREQMTRVARNLKDFDIVGMNYSGLLRAQDSCLAVAEELGRDKQIPLAVQPLLAPGLPDAIWRGITAHWGLLHGEDADWIVAEFCSLFSEPMQREGETHYRFLLDTARKLRSGQAVANFSHEILITLATGIGHNRMPPPLERGVNPATGYIGKGDAIVFAFTFRGDDLAILETTYLPLVA